MNDYSSKLGLYIGGEWLGPGGRDTTQPRNPATGEVIGELPSASHDDLDRALQAAEEGFAQWRDTSGTERANVLRKAAALLRERADDIARIATMEQGKPVAEAKGELGLTASLIEFHAGEAERIYGRVLPRPTGSRSLVLHQPIGVVAAFCAWNFPILNPARKLAPALAAGCSIILKPSEETAGSAIAIMRCFEDAGLPGKVAQMVFGVPDTISRHLLAPPVTRKLSFTGSVPVGKHLMKLAADTVMRSTMELGGHGPVLVFDDCDLDKTLDMLVPHKFRNAGQVCISPTRFHVQEGIYEKFARGFAERTSALRVGSGFESETQMGPMANARRPEAIDAMVENARSEGATVLTGGTRGANGRGFFYQPTVLTDVPMTARLMNDEPFGPVAMISRFASDDDAIAEANRLPYALAAYCFTENGRRQNRLGDEIEAGMIAVNQLALSWPDSPFGGMKDSGFGSEDGPEGVMAHLVTKTFHMK
ncbi:NAD-dependent succinate-semialdehyde dehydrogenase [uncultured Croceicoccus sp.]|uniref:NAD-dependent succinate-semialdehyde dehydrogenase n=1 Tax=uncultured Croceicoccus sp. TaxID=1295329 RepID=UPI00262A3A3B|nr:NAD-dependent succinate-semialdehyde dehydrogenase [uncultured Croceicoccus sp.]